MSTTLPQPSEFDDPPNPWYTPTLTFNEQTTMDTFTKIVLNKRKFTHEVVNNDALPEEIRVANTENLKALTTLLKQCKEIKDNDVEFPVTVTFTEPLELTAFIFACEWFGEHVESKPNGSIESKDELLGATAELINRAGEKHWDDEIIELVTDFGYA